MLKATFKLIFCLLALTLSAFSQRAIIGSVTSVIDGQTITVATSGGSNLTVRLRSIETPDDGQPFSEVVKEHLTALALEKTVDLRIDAISDDAVFGQVVLNRIDLSQQMLRDGAAWYSEDSLARDSEAAYRANEEVAKSEGRGIWGVFGLKKPSELRKTIESAKNPLNDAKVSQLAWEQLGSSVEGVFPSESFTPATGNCGGIVVGIVDGDTVQILNSAGQHITVRLAGIDAPEKSQAYGVAAKQHLSGLIAGRSVSGTSTKKDRYGRTIGKISLNGTDINLSIVRDGFAWHYKEYEKEQSSEDRARYAQAELLARSGRRGLWQENSPIYPSDYRRQSFLARYYEPYVTTSAGAEYTPYSGGSQYSGGGSGPIRVRAYTRSDGTPVRSYTRSRPH